MPTDNGARRGVPTDNGARPALAVLLPGFSGTELPDWLEALLRRGLGGVCLFGENIVDAAQVRRLTDAIRAANPHALIAIDEEGGDVTRRHAATGSPYPGNAILGRIDDLELTAEVGRSVARELAALGVNLNLAPDADVNSDPDNPVIGVRSFGDEPELVARHTAAWVAAHEREGVAVSAKHFPGHGDTALDSHLALPVVDVTPEVLRARDLPPFRSAIAAGARTVMSSHILLPQLDAERPATFSARILGGLLREELGFQGVIVTDALDMAGASGERGIPRAAVDALAAGCDLLCIGTRNTGPQLEDIADGIERAIAEGRLDEARLGDAVARNRRLAESLAGTVPRELDAEAPEPRFDEARIAAAFDVRPGVDPAALPADAVVVAIETAANIAVGSAPWGLAATGHPVVEVREGDALPEGSGPLLVTGKAHHRHPWVCELIALARQRHPGTLVVDLGWPSPDREFADVATFGASRVAASALAGMLGLGAGAGVGAGVAADAGARP
ncbi:glycoside hydrolase family 3 protein [Homoserinibacter sp. YIM 151385]|uniref:glycoside hydrolase family 3 protein n=1 Tax=Homoserinibacter sp. YIM 151385 TaxID=2985506 RepID=UPI0022F0C9CA|nr:glycoside hydrolase family 3 protein [Homoserinibacter sp. YIM 151385]WBU36771.1 glycoside hydrolase family 3 protein [Homoserinibacter sp. YIM 151385]